MAFTGMAPVGSMVLGAIEKFAGLQNIILLSGACCFIASLIFEHYRPIVRKYARPVYVEKGIIKKSGSWFSYDDTKLGQGRDAAKKCIQDNPELAEELEAKIMEALRPATK